MNFLKRRNDSMTKTVESKTASEAMVMQQAYNRMLRDQMNMAVHPAMNAAQGSILGAMGVQSVDYGQVNQRRIESMFDYNRQVQMNIISADNGFVLTMRPEQPGARDRVLVASTIEELRDLITSEMVTRKMEK